MNYLYGWNPVAEFIIDEFIERGTTVHGVVIDDEYLHSSPHPKHLRVFTASGIIFEQNDVVINCLGYKDLMQLIVTG